MTGGPSMSDQAQGDGLELNAPLNDSALATGPGTQLRQAREDAGIHIAALASALKVPVARLEALEQERFDLLPGVPFVRALAASVCRVLKLDPIPILALLPQPARPWLPQRASTTGPSFRTDGRGFGRPPGGLSRPLIGAVVLLVIGAGALLLLPQARLSAWIGDLTAAVSGNSTNSKAATASSEPDGSTGAKVTDNASPTKTSKEVGSQPGLSANPRLNPGSADGGSVSARVSQSVTAQALPARPLNDGALTDKSDKSGKAVASTSSAGSLNQTGSVTGAPAVIGGSASSSAALAQRGSDAQSQAILLLRAKQQSWVKVADAKGVVVLQKNLDAGASESVSGSLPLSVIIGRADATEVSVRGKSFPLAPVTRNNVARFEVK